MLPAKAFTLRRAHEVQPGQFALLLDYANQPIVVTQRGEFSIAVFLKPTDDKSNTAYTSDLTGPAIVFSDPIFEVDPLKCEKLDFMDNRSCCLAIKGSELLIVAVPPSNFGYIELKLQDLPTENSGITYGFRDWRAILRDGEREYVLFESQP